MTGPRHKGISLWTAFLATGFASVRSFGNRSGGDGGEHLDVEIPPSLEMAGGDFGDGLAIVISGVTRAGEADTLQRYVCREGGLAHEGSNQVVSDEVHLDFFVDHGWGFAVKSGYYLGNHAHRPQTLAGQAAGRALSPALDPKKV